MPFRYCGKKLKLVVANRCYQYYINIHNSNFEKSFKDKAVSIYFTYCFVRKWKLCENIPSYNTTCLM